MIRYVDYRPRGAARELFRRHDPEVLMSGPAGTGKTRGVIEKLNAVCEKYPGCRCLLVRKTRTSLSTTGCITYTQLVLPAGNAEVNYQQATYPNGSVLAFGGMDKSSKIMSSEWDVIAVLEATELTEDDWEKLTTRLRWNHVPYQQLIADCNPSSPSHFLKRRANSGATVMLESRHEDNPTLWDGSNWTERGKQYLAKLDALTGVRYLRLRKGVWAAAEGMVYDGYDPSVHLVERFPIPAHWPRIWVVDFGYTNPFVWQAWARDPDGRLFRYREIYRTQTLVSDHAAAIQSLINEGEPRPVAIVCDHDAEDRATLERELKMRTLPAFKRVLPGIQSVQNRLRKAGDGRARLFLMRDSLVQTDESLVESKRPTCTEEEIEGYVWANHATREEPVKKDDHGMDAMRYLVALVDDVGIETMRQPSTLTYVPNFEISRY